MAPFDGAGNFTLPAGSDVATGDTILASDLNTPLDDVEAALSQVLLRSGVAPMTGDLDLGGNDIINAGGAGGTFLTEDDTGTSGHKIPYLDVANTWSALQTFFVINAIGGGTLGGTVSDPVVIKGTLVNAFSSAMWSNADAGAWRTSLGLGTAAVQNIGTSGATVPLLNGANTWAGAQQFSGRVFIGANSEPIQVQQSSNAFTGTFFAFGNPNGQCGAINFTSANTQFATASDGRLKEDQRPIDDWEEIVDQLQPKYWRWSGEGGEEDFGLVAQDVAQIPQVAGVVTKGDDDPSKGKADEGFKMWMMQKGSLEGVLIAAVKGLLKRVRELEEAALP